MSYHGALRDGAPVDDPEAALRHRLAVVVAEVERQPFYQNSLAEVRVLALVVYVYVRLARVAGVAAAADGLPLFDALALPHRDAAALQVRYLQIRPRRKLDDDVVA